MKHEVEKSVNFRCKCASVYFLVKSARVASLRVDRAVSLVIAFAHALGRNPR